MAKLALSVITKNNEETIGRLLASVAKYVDGIFITDTGSTDNTIEIAKQYGAVISEFKWIDDFAAARNFAFAQVPEEFEYILWADSDDEIVGAENLPDIVEQMEMQDITATFFQYNYTIDPVSGHVLVKHARERVVKRGKYEWKGRLHETLIPKGQDKGVLSDLVEVNHWPTQESIVDNEHRNMRILEAQYEAEGENKDPRTEYYLARAYFDAGEYAKANKMFQDYLEHSGWDEERAMAWNYVGEIHKQFNDYESALTAYFEALRERPDYPTWYVNIAMTYALMEKWDFSKIWIKKALAVPAKEKTAMVLNPKDDMARAMETLFMVSFHEGELDEAWAAAQKLAQMFPDQPEFKERFESVTKLRRWNKMTKNAIEIAQELQALKEDYKLEAFINSLPQIIMGNQNMTNFRHTVLPPKTWSDKSIVYFAGKAFEKWDPDSLEKGVGGSETAVIYLAKEWAAKGYDVTVYGWPHKEGVYDGVNYLYWWRCNFTDRFNIFISWRNEQIFKLGIEARIKLLDCHDVLNQADILEVDKDIDFYMVKSNYHRTFLPDVPEDRFKVISNGIDRPTGLRGAKELPRNPFQLAWVSSYDRGLEHLLKMWPKIKEAVPEATLKIAYGWNLFDTAWKGNPERQMWKKRMVELMQQPGITEVGRLSKKALHELHRESAILAYYCHFEEINCISVLEAQANGSVPVTTAYAALNETNEFGIKVAGDPYAKTTKVDYANALINALKNPPSDKKRLEMVTAIREKYDWVNIAKQWKKVFDGKA